MLTATNARSQLIASAKVESEIAILNLNIIGAVTAGNTSVNVYNTTATTVANATVYGTPMTSNVNYYSVWQGVVVDNKRSAEMQTVIDNFTKLGYTISRKSTDGLYIYWQLSW